MSSFIKKVRYYLRPVKRIAWAFWCYYIVVPFVRFNQWRLLKRFKSHQGPIRVLFFVNELTKFKMRSVVETMREDNNFDVTIGFTLADRDWLKTTDELLRERDQLRAFFESLNVHWEELADVPARKVKSISRFGYDIVFYQQPWDWPILHHPAVVSRFALTCYTQYYVSSYGDIKMDVGHLFMWTLCRFYVLAECWKLFYEKNKVTTHRACTFLVAGHPMLDVFQDIPPAPEDGLVIYAPHWSITYPGFLNSEHFSTFIENGRRMLDYAQKHPEIRWVFKPHPNLASSLVSSGAWSQQEVDDYYATWAKFGIACYSNDYPRLFIESRLMITDCASFLTEYASTGRPLIRLVSSTAVIHPQPFQQPLFDSFYNAHSWDELMNFMELLLVKKCDDKRDIRLAAARAAGLIGENSAERIKADILHQAGR